MRRRILLGTLIISVVAGQAAAVPIGIGTVVGIDLGPTASTNWNNFNSNSTKAAGTVVDLTGTVVDGVSISTAGANGYNNDGTNGWGEVPAGSLLDVPDSATTDICWAGGGGAQITLTISGLSTSFLYDLAAVTSAGYTRLDTVTITGSGTPQVSAISRPSSVGGQYHSFTGIAPTVGGVITIGVTDPQANNPIINMVRMEAVAAPGGAIPEPATMCALGLAVCGLGGYVRRRRKA